MKTIIIVMFSFVTGLLLSSLSHATGEIYRYKNFQSDIVYSNRKSHTRHETINGGNPKVQSKTTAMNNNIQNVTPRRLVTEVSVATDTINAAINDLRTQLVDSNIESQTKVIVNFINIQASDIAQCLDDVTEMRGGKFDGSACKEINSLQFKSIASAYSSKLTYIDNFDTAG